MRRSSGMRPMSTSIGGLLRRIFISGSKEWPPASTLASSFACSSAIASSSVAGAAYSKSLGNMSVASIALVDCPPDFLGGIGHVKMADSEVRERVDDRVGHGRAGGDRACLARALNTHRIDRRGRLG